MSRPVTLPLNTFVDGRQWNLFTVAYDTADGQFETYIYAISWEHAVALVEELKETATVSGQLQSTIKP